VNAITVERKAILPEIANNLLKKEPDAHSANKVATIEEAAVGT
jgi:hypothetical protein